MPTPDGSGTERETKRLEAFSDAVLAIAITLPIVESHMKAAGHKRELLPELVALWPSYLAYAISFVVIGLYWSTSHFSGKVLEKTDHAYNLLNLLFLAAVSVVPVPAQVFADHLTDARAAPVGAAILVLGLLAPAAAWSLKWAYADRHDLPDPRLTAAHRRKVALRNYFAVGANGLAGVLVFVEWRLGVAVAAVTTASFLIPPAPPEYKPGQEPSDELEEPDERRDHGGD